MNMQCWTVDGWNLEDVVACRNKRDIKIPLYVEPDYVKATTARDNYSNDLSLAYYSFDILYFCFANGERTYLVSDREFLAQLRGQGHEV